MMRHNHNFLRKILSEKGCKTHENDYSEELYNSKFFEHFLTTNKKIKGGLNYSSNFDDRFKDILSDPNNLLIQRHEDAGKIEGDIITLHNGLKIYAEYYGDFIKILQYNLGVHEPSEERAFQKVLNVLNPESTMIELGSYWSMYSLWFRKTIPNSKSYCFEPIQKNLELGIKNFNLHNLDGTFIKSEIGDNKFDLKNYLSYSEIDYIDILHSDIQGSELEMLYNMKSYFTEQKIKYVFISTHSNHLHQECINFLKGNDYKILCSCDYDNETYQYDGFILSCPNDLNEIDKFDVGNRSNSFIISDELYNKIIS